MGGNGTIGPAPGQASAFCIVHSAFPRRRLLGTTASLDRTKNQTATPIQMRPA